MMAPTSAAGPPASYSSGCASSWNRISSPGRQCTAKATWLHIVPDGRNSAASLPSSSATIAWRRLTVGSSRFCSSPTSASAMARRIAGVGRVTVSLNRSTAMARHVYHSISSSRRALSRSGTSVAAAQMPTTSAPASEQLRCGVQRFAPLPGAKLGR